MEIVKKFLKELRTWLAPIEADAISFDAWYESIRSELDVSEFDHLGFNPGDANFVKYPPWEGLGTGGYPPGAPPKGQAEGVLGRRGLTSEGSCDDRVMG